MFPFYHYLPSKKWLIIASTSPIQFSLYITVIYGRFKVRISHFIYLVIAVFSWQGHLKRWFVFKFWQSLLKQQRAMIHKIYSLISCQIFYSTTECIYYLSICVSITWLYWKSKRFKLKDTLDKWNAYTHTHTHTCLCVLWVAASILLL